MKPASGASGITRWLAAVAVFGLSAVVLWWLLGSPLTTDVTAGDDTLASTPGVVAGEPPTIIEGFYELGDVTQGLDVGQLAPELVGEPGSGAVLTDLDGLPISLASLRGRPVWIVFWATWCPPCQAETPDLQRAYEEHAGEGLELIAIDVQEPAELVAEYMQTYGLGYTAALDPSGAIMRAYRVFGLPTHYLIDRDGIIRERVYGPMTRDQMEERLASILGD